MNAMLKRTTQKLLNTFGYSLLKGVRNNSSYDDEINILKNLEVKTIFDVGANIGQTSLNYRRLFPKATIYAFEPFNESFEKLESTYSRDKLVQAQKLGISNESSKKIFYTNQSSLTNSLLPPSQTDNYYNPKLLQTQKILEIDTVTIDEFCEHNCIEEIQILKLDIQGAELLALQGATKKLKDKSISLIRTEVEFVEVYENQVIFHEICNFLAGMDYKLYNLYGLYNSPKGQLVSADAVFVKPELLS
jgi:FkbM family methyltransferase